jgi:bacterial/archaeal transporter family-2 protein
LIKSTFNFQGDRAMKWLLVLVAVIAGGLLPTQAGINSQLARNLGHPLLAASVSFGIGAIALILYTVVLHISLPPLGQIKQIPWYLWVGGILGTIYLTTTIVLAPLLGAATMIGLIVAGQMLASIALDSFGLVGFPVHPLSFWRAIGAILLIVGVALIQRF